MSNDVVLSAALRSNLLSLQNTQRNIDTTQLRLATGLKVNSALDNPQNFFAAQSLNNRAGDLNRLLDGISQSVRTIEEADNGITSLTKLVEQAESVADSAQAEIRASEGFARISGTVDLRALGGNIEDGTIINNGATDQFGISVTTLNATTGVKTTVTAQINLGATDTVDSIVAAINADATVGENRAAGALVRASVGAGGNLTIDSLSEGAYIRIEDGSATSLTAAGFARLGLDNIVGTENNVATTRNGGTAIAGRVVTSGVSAAGANATSGLFEASEVIGSAGADFTNGFAAAGDDVTLALTVDGQRTTVGTFDDTETIQAVIDGINNASVEGVVAASFNTTTGQIEIEFEDTVGQVEIEFLAVGGGDVSFGFGSGEAGTSAAAVTLAAGNAASEQITLVGSSANLAGFQEDFNNIRSQIDDLVEDASYRGVNLLSGDNLTTFFNEDRSNSLVTEGADFTSLGLGIGEADFTTSANVQLSLDDVRSALESVRAFGSSISNDLAIIQTRRDFTEQTINTLEAGADDLTVADQNEEGANLLALQTRQQLGVTSLSLAAQSQQSVLRLF